MTPGRRPAPFSQPRPATNAVTDTTWFGVGVVATQAAHTASSGLALVFVASVTAVQSPAVASVQATERFITSLAALQAASTAAATATERFAADVSATQGAANCAAQLALVADVSLAVTAGQTGATATAVLATPASQQGGGAVMHVPMAQLYRKPHAKATKPASRSVVIAVQQPAHASSVLLSVIPRAAISLVASQPSARCAVRTNYDHLNITDEEALLLVTALAA